MAIRWPTFALSLVAFGLAVVGAVAGLYLGVLHLTIDPAADVHAYYDAATRLNAGLPLYEQSASTNDAEFYRYPPLLAIVFRPLATLPFHVAAVVWAGVLVACLIGTVMLLGVRNRWTWLMLGWLAAPIAWSLAVGQAQIPVAFLMTTGTPVGLALAGHLKVFPALAAVYWLGRREWRPLLQFAGWVAVLTLVSFALEPNGTIAYLTFSSLEQVGEVRNLSPYAISPWLWAATVVALPLAALLLARTRAGWLLAVALTVFVTPRLFMYQFTSLLAAGRAPEDRRASRLPGS